MRLLTNPSSFDKNPSGFAMNQIGHAALGAAFLAFGWPLWIWVAGYLAWEGVQLAMFDASLWDCLEDAGFAIGGALAVAYGWPVLIVLALFLASGVARRF